MHNNITQAEDLAVLHDPSYLLASPPSVPAAFSLVGKRILYLHYSRAGITHMAGIILIVQVNI
jgi:hypothetical protein